RSTALLPAQAPMWPWPAISYWRHARRASRKHSFESVSCRIAAAPGSCRDWSGPRVHAPWRSRANRCRRRRGGRGGGSGKPAAANKLRRLLASAPAVALALTKRALDESWSNDLDTQLDLERESQREAGLSPDFAEGAQAFLQKRPPVFMSRRE